MIVRFYGGPYGGEERVYPDNAGRYIRVAVLPPRPRVSGRGGFSSDSLHPFEIQEYEYDSSVDANTQRYRWVDPYGGLRDEIAMLKKANASLESIVDELEERPTGVEDAIADIVRRTLREALTKEVAT